MTSTTVSVTAAGLGRDEVLAAARHGARVRLTDDALAAMATSRSIVDDIESAGRPVYGVSTGFGALADTFIAPARRAELQHALIRSHAAGVGAAMPPEVVRAMMLLRVRSLALGHSGLEVSQRFKISQARVCQLRRELQESWQAFHGEATKSTAVLR